MIDILEQAKPLPPSLLRPAKLSDVRSPGVLMQTSDYGAPFLVVGDGDDAFAIFLHGCYKFHTFKRLEGENYSGLAIENVEFEVEIQQAVDIAGLGRVPGMMIRRGTCLAIAAISDDRFRRVVEVIIHSDLPEGCPDQIVGFRIWRAFVMVRDEKRIVWECSVSI